MKTAFAVIGFVVVALVVETCVACTDDDDDKNSQGRLELVSHEYGDCDPSWSDCGQDDYSQDYSSRDRNRNRGRNRGAFSPGPFDDSPVDAFNGNTICLPGSTCYGDDRQRQEEPPR